MKKLQWHRYQVLELISDQPPVSYSAQLHKPQPTSWLQALWQRIDLAFFRDLEPRIWQSTDPRTGQSHWHLYNPETGKTSHLNSESVRQWLEQILHH
jgi:hypothetical protein